MPFDVERARQSGYSTAEIADFIAKNKSFDTKAARESGYNDDEILEHLLRMDVQKKPEPVTATQRATALGSGINKSVAQLLGMPTDLGANLIDLGKAGAGAAYGLTTGKTPPDSLLPMDRAAQPGTSEWFAKQLNKRGVPTEPERPDDMASRLLNLGGTIGGGVYFGSALPGQPPKTPVQPPMRSPMSSSNASASASPGVASATNVVSANPSVHATGGGSSFGYVADDAVTGLSRGQQEAADAGRAMGMRLTPGQATGNKLLQRLEAKMESQPFSAGPFDRIKDANQKTLNRTWAKAIGESGDDLSSSVLGKASDRIGAVFDDVRDEVVRDIDPGGFVTHMKGVSDEFENIAGQIWKNPQVSRLVSMAEQGGATGKDLGAITSKLGREANKQMTSANGDRELGQALYQVKDYVDDLVEAGLEGGRKADYQVARKEYRNLMLLTQRVGNVNPSSGNVSGLSLANMLQGKDRGGFLYGGNKSDQYNAVRFAQAFKPIVGDSGTATRTPITSPLDLLLKAPINIASRAYTSSPAVDLAVRAQAAGNVAGDVARGAGRATGVTSPLGLLFGAQSATGLLDDYRGR